MCYVSCAANLEENEKIKADLMPTKINEPKTPYHAPLGEDDDLEEGAIDATAPPCLVSLPFYEGIILAIVDISLILQVLQTWHR